MEKMYDIGKEKGVQQIDREAQCGTESELQQQSDTAGFSRGSVWVVGSQRVVKKREGTLSRADRIRDGVHERQKKKAGLSLHR